MINATITLGSDDGLRNVGQCDVHIIVTAIITAVSQCDDHVSQCEVDAISDHIIGQCHTLVNLTMVDVMLTLVSVTHWSTCDCDGR